MSNINTNNLTVNYPLVGVNNSTQGFRDNFASIKTNLDLAAEELSDLQSKVLLKSPLTSSVLDNNMNGALISNALIQGFRNVGYNLGSNLTGTTLINLTKADAHYGYISANSTISLQFAGWAPDGTKSSVDVYFTVSDSNTFINLTGVNLDNSKSNLLNFKNNRLSAPVFSGSEYVLAYRFSTLDCGTTITIEPLTTARKTSQLSIFRTPVPIGSRGDQQGSICFDSSFLYLCVNDFDGVTAIWRKIPLATI